MISVNNNLDRIKKLAVMSLNLEKHKTDFKALYIRMQTLLLQTDRSEIEDYCDCLKHTSPTVVWPAVCYLINLLFGNYFSSSFIRVLILWEFNAIVKELWFHWLFLALNSEQTFFNKQITSLFKHYYSRDSRQSHCTFITSIKSLLKDLSAL